MEIFLRSPAGLYPRLLGDAWRNLDDAVQRVHGSGAIAHAAGVFHVRHGRHPLARLLARLAQLPAAGEAVDVQLVVTPWEDGEEWRRTFAERPLVSKQAKGSDGLLVERMGAVELRFQLEVVGGALSYRTRRAALCLGAWRVPLPRWLSPRVTACEKPVGDRHQVYVSVEVNFPSFGLLMAYEGKLTSVEAQG